MAADDYVTGNYTSDQQYGQWYKQYGRYDEEGRDRQGPGTVRWGAWNPNNKTGPKSDQKEIQALVDFYSKPTGVQTTNAPLYKDVTPEIKTLLDKYAGQEDFKKYAGEKGITMPGEGEEYSNETSAAIIDYYRKDLLKNYSVDWDKVANRSRDQEDYGYQGGQVSINEWKKWQDLQKQIVPLAKREEPEKTPTGGDERDPGVDYTNVFSSTVNVNQEKPVEDRVKERKAAKPDVRAPQAYGKPMDNIFETNEEDDLETIFSL
jgi:hypothetical protein